MKNRGMQMHMKMELVRSLMLGLGIVLISLSVQAATVDFRDDGTFVAPSYSEGGVTVTGSGDVHLLNVNGLGIVGGAFDSVVDSGEWIKFSFDMPAENVSYWIASAGQTGGSTPGKRTIEAFGIGGISLGLFEEEWAAGTDLSALYGGALIESFILTSEAVTSFRLGTVDFDLVQVSAVPLPAAIPLYASGLALLGFLGWRKKKSG